MIFNNLIKEVKMAEDMARVDFDRILVREGIKGKNIHNEFWKKLPKEDLKEKKLISILRMFKLVKIISQSDN